MTDPHQQSTISDEIVDLYLEGDGENEDWYDTGLSWDWIPDPDAVAAFTRLCALAQPGQPGWSVVADSLEWAADAHNENPALSTLTAFTGEVTPEGLGRWLFSPAAAGAPPEGQWIHDGTAEHAGVRFTAFTAIGVEEHFGVALLTDGDSDWLVSYSSV